MYEQLAWSQPRTRTHAGAMLSGPSGAYCTLSLSSWSQNGVHEPSALDTLFHPVSTRRCTCCARTPRLVHRCITTIGTAVVHSGRRCHIACMGPATVGYARTTCARSCASCARMVQRGWSISRSDLRCRFGHSHAIPTVHTVSRPQESHCPQWSHSRGRTRAPVRVRYARANARVRRRDARADTP